MDILRKQIATNADLVAIVSANATLTFSLEVTGMDAARPNQKTSVTGLKPEDVQALIALNAMK